ncbi:hypothetical protein COB64_02395 [Candidatus Wolfebacteria bacterium]|nr:MAG: hypothetical protein COB64_02395 [Candidatus Wolfebacteria bacterium]
MKFPSDNKNEIPDGAFSLALPNEKISEHNIYKPGFGYITDHISEDHQRGQIIHWDEQYKESDSFEESWKPRPGPLEFIYNLTKETTSPLIILNMGAGLGDFTSDLAHIPNTIVHHVDFSKQGNDIARRKAIDSQVMDNIEIHTIDNDGYLNQFINSGKKADVVFLYGASGSNEPNDIAYQKTLELSVSALKKKGYLWHVSMLQPRLVNSSDLRIQDTLGDFPKPPGMAKRILTNVGMQLIDEETSERPDFHPLVPGGDPKHHLHLVYRGLFVKTAKNENERLKFKFGFRDSVSERWGDIWSKLKEIYRMD